MNTFTNKVKSTFTVESVYADTATGLAYGTAVDLALRIAFTNDLPVPSQPEIYRKNGDFGEKCEIRCINEKSGKLTFNNRTQAIRIPGAYHQALFTAVDNAAKGAGIDISQAGNGVEIESRAVLPELKKASKAQKDKRAKESQALNTAMASKPPVNGDVSPELIAQITAAVLANQSA